MLPKHGSISNQEESQWLDGKIPKVHQWCPKSNCHKESKRRLEHVGVASYLVLEGGELFGFGMGFVGGGLFGFVGGGLFGFGGWRAIWFWGVASYLVLRH